MNQTTNLHLPQFAETDRIHHDDFNDAFSKIDAAVPFVKLADITLTESGTSVSLDLSQYDLTEFADLKLYLDLKGSEHFWMRLNNNAEDAYFGGQDTQLSTYRTRDGMRNCLLTLYIDRRYQFIFSSPCEGSCVLLQALRLSRDSNSCTSEIYTGASDVLWEDLESIDFQAYQTFGVGSRFILTGIRK